MDGWEPRTVTEFVRDANGNVVQEVHHRESEFDDEQRDWLIAYARYKSELGPHGFLMSEATSPDADPSKDGGTFKFVAREKPTTDWAKKAELDRVDAYKKKHPDANLNGLIFRVEKEEL